jgi:nicotinate-nucleotide pyrophosphorylase (carboxylating)
MDWDSGYIDALITAALAEDVGSGDVSATATASPTAAVSARMEAGEQLVCAGLPLIERILRRLAPDISVELRASEGQTVSGGVTLAALDGNADAILAGERTVLNFLCRLSGIATRTRQYVDAISGAGPRICDSRNTTPGLRQFEHYAVGMGGGTHRRAGLFDAIVLTPAHIRVAGGVKAALDQAHSYVSRLMSPQPLSAYEATGTVPSASEANSLPIQIAVENEKQLREALSAGAECILFEDMPAEHVRELTQVTRSIRQNCIVEISGDIPLEGVRAYADSGVDYISPDRLIRGAPAVAIRLLVDSSE